MLGENQEEFDYNSSIENQVYFRYRNVREMFIISDNSCIVL
jgi:hypothetical protein